MFSGVQSASSQRLSEVRQLLDVIKILESSDPLVADGQEVRVLRGLFYVHLYGVFEFSVNRAVERLLDAVSKLNIAMCDLEPALMSLSLDSEFHSFVSQDNKKRWQKRINFLSRQHGTEKVVVTHSIVANYLQNIWQSNLLQLFECLYLSDPIVPTPNLSPYIDEIVNKRNQIAHGRESPIQVGAGTRSPELQVRLDAMTQIITHIISCFDNHLSTVKFVRKANRAPYLSMLPV